MLIKTTRFGEIEIEGNKVINFPYGIIGFRERKKYVLLNYKEGSPFQWLQSVEDEDLAFLAVSPFYFFPYEFEIPDWEQVELELEKSEDVAVLVLVTVPSDPKKISCNLLAPIIVNTKTNQAKQIVLETDKYTTKHFILEEMEKMGKAVSVK